MPQINKHVPNFSQFFPLNEPEIGTVLKSEDGDKIPLLFTPITLGGILFKNRIFVSPMCQYSSDNGHATDWHFVHIGGFATRGVGAICMEATAVLPEGRISPEDAGLWQDSQIEPLKRIIDFSHAQGTKIGVQLSHAGRKASTHAPWVQTQGGHSLPHTAFEDENGWPSKVLGPSDIPFSPLYPTPKEITEEGLLEIENAFLASIERCARAGFDFIELHGAHGYLLQSILSPISNTRSDQYGGQPLENRMRFFLSLVKLCREAWKKPLFVRISAHEWMDGPEKSDEGVWRYWGIEQSIILAGKLKEMGIDLIDCSSGGNWVNQKISVTPGYQVPFAEALKKSHPDIAIGTVGLISDPVEAEGYLQKGQADVVLLGRELLRNPHWPLHAAHALQIKIKPANQYTRAWF